ncbi:hypothetical protein JW897_12120 [Chromobacterium alkanivorans]|uniref:hypothetical protein n=1 Tax=Chromobacterium alkanivorans TaxID=1071719 RepID=UPI001967A0FB|nr:hypothetical protein [Chromobacterium alkanivorans]MBN3004481.1 hypothetical protein [Chromobacterium alkanivorans]
MTTIQLIQPVEPQRDEQGYWTHPDIPNFDEDAAAYTAWLKEQRLTVRSVWLEWEEEDHPAYASYFEIESNDIREWKPEHPPGWFLLGIWDTEDGPVATFAKREEPEHKQCTCGPVRHWECNAGSKARGGA